MNTLNNIHALVDIDTGKAKSTIVELSKLMRYVLYEASNKTILLSREIQFLENYVTLMSLRYPDRVSIEKNFPLEVPEVQIPPLLFVSFVENAFKHGISYRKESFVHVVMQLEDGNRLSFRCTNSTGGSSDEQHHGIGLENVRKRLRLLFGNDYTLSITEEDNKFDVLLIVPLL
jgi:putative two-component system sensor protein